MDLTNKVVVVTGGSAGLGEQICYEAVKQGRSSLSAPAELI